MTSFETLIVWFKKPVGGIAISIAYKWLPRLDRKQETCEVLYVELEDGRGSPTFLEKLKKQVEETVRIAILDVPDQIHINHSSFKFHWSLKLIEK